MLAERFGFRVFFVVVVTAFQIFLLITKLYDILADVRFVLRWIISRDSHDGEIVAADTIRAEVGEELKCVATNELNLSKIADVGSVRQRLHGHPVKAFETLQLDDFKYAA